MKRAEILDAARTCVCGGREQDYGTPEDSFGMIAKLWTAYLGRDVNPMDTAVMMGLLKIARVSGGRSTQDSFIDLAGYAACAGELATEPGTKQPKADDDQELEKLRKQLAEANELCDDLGEQLQNSLDSEVQLQMDNDTLTEDLHRYVGLATYEHMRDLVCAEADRKLFVAPCAVGDDVYYVEIRTRLDRVSGKAREYTEAAGPYRVTEIGTRGFWTSSFPNDDDKSVMAEFTQWEDVGRTAFFTWLEAQEAMRNMKQSKEENTL
jgi:hypothetical protein